MALVADFFCSIQFGYNSTVKPPRADQHHKLKVGVQPKNLRNSCLFVATALRLSLSSNSRSQSYSATLQMLLISSYRFLTDPKLLNSYYYNRHGRSKPENRVCDDLCQKLMLCEINHIVSTDIVQCLL